jgi:hypothetical protein
LLRVFGGPHERNCFRVKKCNSFVDQYPHEPTTKGTFALETWWIVRSHSLAASHRILRFTLTAKDPDSNELEYMAASPKPIFEKLAIAVEIPCLFVSFH